MRRRLALALPAPLLALALLGLPACGGGGGDEARPLPPNGTEAIAELFDEKLRPLGWEVQRASLEDNEIPTPVPGKRHFAVYVRPIGTPTPADYIEGLATVTKIFMPSVFDDYAELASFDVCLEPTESEDPSGYPEAVTQIVVTRDQAAKNDWAALKPVDVIRAGRTHPNTLTLTVHSRLGKTPEWAAIQAEALSRK